MSKLQVAAKADKSRHLARTVSVCMALIFIAGGRFIPAPEGLSASAMQVLGIFAGTLILWIREAIDWPSLLCLAALAFVPELKFKDMLAVSFGGQTFAFLLFTFMCTYALSGTHFVRRVALAFINSHIAKKGPWSFAIFFFSSTLVLGSFMSPSVLFVIYLPIIKEVYDVLHLKPEDKFSNMLMIGMTISIAISSGMTPIAHVFSIMAMGFYEAAAGKRIQYIDYIIFGVCVGLIVFVFMLLLFRFLMRPDTSVLNKNRDFDIGEKVPPMDRKEKIILSIFGIVILLWLLPGFLVFFRKNAADYINSFGTAVPPLLGACAMYILTDSGKPLLSFKETMAKGISWGALIMTASTLALGAAMTNEDIGLIKWLSASITPSLNSLSPILLVFIFTLWAAIQTNLSSNMVTITVVCAVALPICMASQGEISTPGVVSITGMIGAFAFMTPPAHPNVALAIGSGWTDTKQMFLYGGIAMIVSVLVSVLIGYPIAAALMGY